MGRRLASALALAVLIGTMAAGTTSASTTLEDYGAQFQCRYRTVVDSDPQIATAHRIVVTPPIMFGEPGVSKVGWRAIVHRYGPAKTIRGALQTSTVWDGQAGDFSPESFRVLLADNLDDSPWYTVSLKMIWYAPDGTVVRRLAHDFLSVYDYVDGQPFHHLYGDACGGYLQLEQI